MLSRAVRTASFGINRAASTLVLAEVNGAGELQGMISKLFETTHFYGFSFYSLISNRCHSIGW